jgi:uncharacterized membrane protein YtjA (UPF0391 family)
MDAYRENVERLIEQKRKGQYLVRELQVRITEEQTMLHWTLVFLVIALIAALLGFGGIAGAAAGIAKVLFFVFLVIWILAFFVGRRAV